VATGPIFIWRSQYLRRRRINGVTFPSAVFDSAQHAGPVSRIQSNHCRDWFLLVNQSPPLIPSSQAFARTNPATVLRTWASHRPLRDTPHAALRCPGRNSLAWRKRDFLLQQRWPREIQPVGAQSSFPSLAAERADAVLGDDDPSVLAPRFLLNEQPTLSFPGASAQVGSGAPGWGNRLLAEGPKPGRAPGLIISVDCDVSRIAIFLDGVFSGIT